jgi:hypothetical protein
MGSDESRSDIFGMHANTLQGADVLATQSDIELWCQTSLEVCSGT